MRRFSDQTLQRDFETGQLAAIKGKHSDDCPFRLPERRAAWQRGHRNAKHNNPSITAVSASKSTQRHIANIKNKLNQHSYAK